MRIRFFWRLKSFNSCIFYLTFTQPIFFFIMGKTMYMAGSKKHIANLFLRDGFSSSALSFLDNNRWQMSK